VFVAVDCVGRSHLVEGGLHRCPECVSCSACHRSEQLLEFGKGHFDRVVVVATDETALQQVERELAEEGLLVAGRIETVLREIAAMIG